MAKKNGEQLLEYKGVFIAYGKSVRSWPEAYGVSFTASPRHPMYYATSKYGSAFAVNPKWVLQDAKALVDAALRRA